MATKVAEYRAVQKTELQVGDWVQFFTTKTKGVSSIYQSDQWFLVISREDDIPGDPCRCSLVDIICKEWQDYSTKRNAVWCDQLLPNGEIRVFSRGSVEEFHGKNEVGAVYQKAQELLQGWERYYTMYSAGKTLGKK